MHQSERNLFCSSALQWPVDHVSLFLLQTCAVSCCKSSSAVIFLAHLEDHQKLSPWWHQMRLNVRIRNPRQVPVVRSSRLNKWKMKCTSAHGAERVFLTRVISKRTTAFTRKGSRTSALSARSFLTIAVVSLSTCEFIQVRSRISAPSAGSVSLRRVISQNTCRFTHRRSHITAHSVVRTLITSVISSDISALTQERGPISVRSVRRGSVRKMVS